MALLHVKVFLVCLYATSSSERVGRKRRSVSLASQIVESELHLRSEQHPSSLISLNDTQVISVRFHDYVTALRNSFGLGSQRKETVALSRTEETHRDRILSVLACTGIVILGILAFLVVLLCFTPCWLGPAIRATISGLDKMVLGVDILVESISVNPFSGRVKIKGFKVCNPSGYREQYMLEMEKLILDLKMSTLFYTLMKSMFSKSPIHIVINHFVFVKFQAMVEKHSMHTSNVKQILDHVMEATKKKQEAQQGETPVADSATQETDKKSKKPKPKITLQEIKIQDIDIRFQVEGAMFGKRLERGCDITIADFNYTDFSKEHGSLMVDDIALFVLQTVLKMIVTNIAGKVGNEWF